MGRVRDRSGEFYCKAFDAVRVFTLMALSEVDLIAFPSNSYQTGRNLKQTPSVTIIFVVQRVGSSK